VDEAVRRKEEWKEANKAVGEALESRPGPQWENHGSKFSSDDEGDGPENTTAAIRICLRHIGSETRRMRKEASKQEEVTYELRRWCYTQLNGMGWTMQQWAEAGRSAAGRERRLELAGPIFADRNQLMEWTREWDWSWEKMSKAWKDFQRISRLIKSLKSGRMIWALAAGARGERINRDEWGPVQRNRLGWRGGRNLEEDSRGMWENRGKANITWAEKVAPAIEQDCRRSKEGWSVWMRWAVAEKAEAERNGQRAIAKKLIARIIWRVARIPRSNETSRWTREAGHRIKLILKVLREVGAVSIMTRVGHVVEEAARRGVSDRRVEQGVEGDGMASGERIAPLPRGGKVATREEEEDKEKERKKEAAIGVVINWMKENDEGRAGRWKDRARKLLVLDHGLSGVEKYVAYLRRKREGGKEGKAGQYEKIRWKQGSMRVALEETLMHEHGECEGERKQRGRWGNRWSTRAEGGWRRIGISTPRSKDFRKLMKEVGKNFNNRAPGWKKGGREYSSDEEGDGPGEEPLEIVYLELTLDIIERLRVY
jgi:hypothetical protein